MKKSNFLTICVVALFFAVFTGCENKPSAGVVQLEIANKQLADNLKMYKNTWDEIINNGNIDLINDTNFASNITLVTKPNNIVGIEAFKDYYKNYLVGFSNITFTVEDVFGQGDKIVKHWNFKGTHSGEFFGIPATGKEVNIEGVTLVIMKNGRIVREQDFMDNLEFMQQLGVIPRE